MAKYLERVGLDGRGRCPASQIFQRHAAARRNRAGHPARSAGGDSGRADVRTRSGGPSRSSRHHSRTEESGPHGFFFHAHSVGRRNALRSRGRAGRRKAAGRGRAARDRLHEVAMRWRFCSKSRDGRPLPADLAAQATKIGARSRITVPEDAALRRARQIAGRARRASSPFRPCTPRSKIISSRWWARASPKRRPRGDFSMSATVGPVAINTFREAVRDRVLYNLVFFALLMIGAAILVGGSIHRHRAAGHRQSRPFGHFDFRIGDGRLHRRRPGVQGNREAHALQPAGQSRYAAGNFWWASMRDCCSPWP